MFKVTNAEVDSVTIFVALDITITHDGKDYDLELAVKYDDMPNFGTTDISWEIAGGDDSILEEDDVEDQLDDFVQEYVLQNIAKL
jgi:hypothetical protein